MDFVHPDDWVITQQEAENIFNGHYTQYFRNRYLRSDGRIVYLMWSSRYDARLGIMYAVARDITELVKAERYQQHLIMLTEQPPPLMMHAKEQVSQLDYDLGNKHYPINVAMQLALEKVLFKAYYSSFDNDQQIA